MKPLLSINRLSPKKSLGQNFIHDEDFIFKLSKLIHSDNDTNIFEDKSVCCLYRILIFHRLKLKSP